jgi:hypothetical protein
MRDALVAALTACAKSRPSRWRTRRFLTGLSSDELQFIAGYLGACVPGFPAGWRRYGTAQPQWNAATPCADTGMAASQSRDREHKMILLVEFLGRSGMRHAPLRTQSAHWN